MSYRNNDPLGGQLTGNETTAVVIDINGATVPIAGSLVTGNTLGVTGASALGYSALNLAGGTGYVTGTLPAGNQAAQAMSGAVGGTTAASTIVLTANAGITGVLPTANQAAQTMTGDVIGNTGANTLTLAGDVTGRAGVTVVGKIQGNTVTAGSLTKGQFFVASSNSNWAATTLSGDISESASVAGQLTVASIQGVVISGTPLSGYTLQATSGSAASWQVAASGFTAGGDLTGTSTSQNVVNIHGASVPIAGSLTTGNVLQVLALPL